MPAQFLLQKSHRLPWLIEIKASNISFTLEEVNREDFFALFCIWQIHKENFIEASFPKILPVSVQHGCVAITNTGEVFSASK